jgi:competence protein ComEC
MKIWHQYPFVRLLIPLIAGIVLALISGIPFGIPLWVFVMLILIFLLIVFVRPLRVPYKFRWLLGLFLNLTLIVAGYLLTFINTPLFDKNNINNFISATDEFIVRVDEPVSEKANSWKVIAKVLTLRDSSHWSRAGGKVILYFEKDTGISSIQYGDILIINSTLEKVKSPQNPGEFNYSKYLSNKGIYNQGYVRSEAWELLAYNRGNPLKALGIRIRNKFMSILRENNVAGREFAVASAILLGADDYLDADQRRAFAGAGAMHILCVSGLHVGIIYLVLNSLLAFLNKNRILKILKVILLLFLIWLYALITGFSPSVSRAATMFSFIIVGASMRRRSNIYNILAASAFVLLVFNPYLITEVGFQLSYIAVAGIVWIYKPLSNLFIPDNKIVQFIWRITVVSFAATLTTFPLSLFYFHQFPFLFLVTNLIAIPFSMIIIYTGLLVLATSFVPSVSAIIGMLLSKFVWILNASVEYIEGLPFATYRGAFLSAVELLLIFSLTISIIVVLMNHRKSFVYLFLSFTLFLLSSFTFRKYESLKQRNIIVYDIGKVSAFQLTNGKKAILIADSAFLVDTANQEYHILNNLWMHGIKVFDRVDIAEENINGFVLKINSFIQFYEKRIFIVDEKTELFPSDDKIKVDYLILSHNSTIRVENLLRSIDFRKLIFDSSNSSWKVKQWKAECLEAGVDYYDVRERGAFTVSAGE